MNEDFIYPEEIALQSAFADLDRINRLVLEINRTKETEDTVAASIYSARLSALVGEETMAAAGGKKGLLGRAKDTGKRIVARIIEMIKSLWKKISGGSDKKKKKIDEAKKKAKENPAVTVSGKSAKLAIPGYVSTSNKMFSLGGAAKLLDMLGKDIMSVSGQIEKVVKSGDTDIVDAIDSMAGATLAWHGFNSEGKFLGGIHRDNALMLESKGPVKQDTSLTFEPVDTRKSKIPFTLNASDIDTAELDEFAEVVKTSYDNIDGLWKANDDLSKLISSSDVDPYYVAANLKFFLGLIKYYAKLSTQGWTLATSCYTLIAE